MQKEKNFWTVPIPPDSVQPETTWTTHVRPEKADLPWLYTQSHQLVTHAAGVVKNEFYRFGREGVFLLGYETTDSTDLFTVYNPPLLLLPNKLNDDGSIIMCEISSKIWNAVADSFQITPTIRFLLATKESGIVQLDKDQFPAFLIKMSLSQDAVLQFGDRDLILPDAVMVQSHLLVLEDYGPMAEWEIKTSTAEPPLHSLMNADDQMKKTRQYIKVTLHQKI
ncbi:hypothetical protein JW998_15680 [candidate division KSB1 bacterium]|nr:hypothetical protein [candidate division KSB1 bacterium]